MAILTTSAPGYAVLRSNEGKALKAYRDVVGVWTIGYGQTNADGKALGINIVPGLVITEAQAEDLLRRSVTQRYEPAVRVAMGLNVRQQDFDAGIDFHFNTGAIKRASWVKSFVAKNLPAVHSQLMSWNKGGGRVLAALTRRRNREWEMISTGNYGPEGKNFHATAGNPAPAAPVSTAPAVPAPVPTAPVVIGVAEPGTLKPGDSGPEVSDLQHQLVAVGYADTGTEGVFGAKTTAAVTDFQKRHPQLRADGKVGPATRATLQRDIDAKATLAGTVKKVGGGGALGTTLDVATGGHMPWWIYVGLGIAFVAALGVTAWKYRDEIRGMLLANEKNSTVAGG